jgi:hypothetical protein
VRRYAARVVAGAWNAGSTCVAISDIVSSSGQRLRRKCSPMCCARVAHRREFLGQRDAPGARAEAVALQRFVRVLGEIEVDEAHVRLVAGHRAPVRGALPMVVRRAGIREAAVQVFADPRGRLLREARDEQRQRRGDVRQDLEPRRRWPRAPSRSNAICARKFAPRDAKSRPNSGYSTGRSPLATPSRRPPLSASIVAADLSVSSGSRSAARRPPCRAGCRA